MFLILSWTFSFLTDQQLQPVSVTSVMTRVFERMITKKFINDVVSSNNLFDDQFAFRPAGGTTAALSAILKEVTTILKDDASARVIDLHVSKAFDTVRHSILLRKLRMPKMSDELYNWILDFITSRSQITRMNEKMSSESIINAGVVQGSVLGPLAFSVAISDLKPTIADDIC